jgi:putative selenium metabolism protein SsnA
MLLIGHGRVITRDDNQPYLENGCVVVQDNLISEVGATSDMQRKYPKLQFIDARKRVIMPGLINTHTHLYSTFARGLLMKAEPPENFPQILERLWWRLDKALTLDDIYYSAMVPLIDCIKCGTTTIFDHHASPAAVRDSLFTIARATSAAGIRSCLCYEVSDRDGATVAAQGIAENVAFITHCKNRGDSMLEALFGLHASFTLSDETLRQCRTAGEDLGAGFHVHTAEAPEDMAHCLKKYGKPIVERFADFGIIGPKTIAAHCVHVNDREIELLLASATNVVHNPESNMGNAVGCAPVLKMLDRGVRVGLGTDGYTCDMLESLKVANILHKHEARNPSVGWVQAPAMLFGHNSAIGQTTFGRPLGKLTPGAYADIIIVDYDPPTPMVPANLNSHVLFGMTGRAVATTIINGRVVMEEGKLAAIDEQEIIARAREAAQRVWQRI